jgi:DNA mismatch endonuclease, patch repair protein
MDKISKEHRSWNMSRIKGKNTKPEIIVRKLLHSMGYRFRLHRKDLPGKPDIVLPKYKTVIFVNGCFWHGHEKCIDGHIPKTNSDYWREKIKKNIERDSNNIAKLEKDTWDVVVIWECETRNCEYLVERINSMLINKKA